ncbi:MAG TPA: DUF5103 domain-containing protein [Cyclobacteriaceae bacterium]|nr:DUF5103 domain-containing protein [Cyclobacteriaceae bacterium]
MKNKLFNALLLLLMASVPASYYSGTDINSKHLRLQDWTYEPEIRTVLLRPDQNVEVNLQPSVTALDNYNMVLAFDDLRNQNQFYNAKLIHCNYDWTKSTLLDLDFLDAFNEFPINNFDYSIDTAIPYVHYTFQVPRVKLPGNYVLLVYRGSNQQDIILTKRFSVFQNEVNFIPESSLVGPGAFAQINQQINFTIRYRNYELVNPMDNVWVVIRQNQRWDNVVSGLKPNFVREGVRELEYRFFDKSLFTAGNEFRFFDIRSLRFPGQNIYTIDRQHDPVIAKLGTDINRSTQRYAQYLDLNGNFVVENADFGDGARRSDYLFVRFNLPSKPIDGKVYVMGAYNAWNKTIENEMYYDNSNQAYTADLLLKQGWYDYTYHVESQSLPAHFFEGSFFETENWYEIMVYYRPFKPNADLLIGYFTLGLNPSAPRRN